MASEVALGIEKKCTNSDYADTFLDGLRKMRVRQKVSGKRCNNASIELTRRYAIP